MVGVEENCKEVILGTSSQKMQVLCSTMFSYETMTMENMCFMGDLEFSSCNAFSQQHLQCQSIGVFSEDAVDYFETFKLDNRGNYIVYNSLTL